jgi:NTP pyrophosphatase (non-canonical NTP hydrolase)
MKDATYARTPVALAKAQSDVAKFHTAFKLHIGNWNLPEWEEDIADRRITLIEEESSELVESLYQGDLPSIAKEICDLIYVALGTAIELGIDIDPVWEEVQASNMSKVGGTRRADGKWLKPDNYVSPNIEGVLAKQVS